jgi:glycosyltransferase involved in cell wall biosynthesis
VVTTPHGWSKEPDLKLRFYEGLNRLVFLGLDKVAPLSREIYDGLKKIPGISKKLQLIENAVDLAELEKARAIPPEVQRARQEGFFILGYIGQLIHRKGVDILLRALSLLSSEGIKAFVIGEGPLRGELENLAGELGLASKVVFTGYREDRLHFLRGFDVFVLPSRLEGVPRCLMEAMGVGKPVIASDIEGCRGLIPKDGDQGVLFPVNDFQALGERIRYLLANDQERKALGERARAFVVKNYSAERMVREYETLYLDMIE